MLAQTADEDYMGDEWIGMVEIGDKIALIKHSMDWIRGECQRFGLTVQNVGDLHGHTWLLIAKPGEGS